MTDPTKFDAIIIGGSFAGLSAAMCLGRALRKVLVIDSGNPCNRFASHTQNLITHDGESPKAISDKAKAQAIAYPTVQFIETIATSAQKTDGFFEIGTQNGAHFQAKKLLFASGVTDIMPEIPGFSECWGVSILHCAYCHGYEVKGRKTGIIGNGELVFELSKMISHWTDDLTVFTNGKSVFSVAETEKLKSHEIVICDKEIQSIAHENGQVAQVVFQDGSKERIGVLYAHPHTEQQCDLFAKLGCKINEHNCIETDAFQKTNIYGIYAAGDCSSVGRAVSVAIASGTVAAMFLNREMIEEDF